MRKVCMRIAPGRPVVGMYIVQSARFGRSRIYSRYDALSLAQGCCSFCGAHDAAAVAGDDAAGLYPFTYAGYLRY